jgi:O-antigen ligase
LGSLNHPSARTATSRLGSRLTLRSVFEVLVPLSVVLTPILIPPIGANAVPGDIVNTILIVVGLIWTLRARVPLRIPLGVGFSLFVLGGLIALPRSIDPLVSAVTIAQDVYLFAWFVVLSNILRARMGWGVELAAQVWIFTAALAALAASLAPLAHPQYLSSLLGWPTVDAAGRSMTTFRNPNLAATYFAVSLFVLWASPAPAKKAAKGLLTVPFLLALVATASNTALVCVACGAALAVVLAILQRLRIGVAAVFALLSGALLLLAFLPQMWARGSPGMLESFERSRILSRSLGRLDDSIGDRRQRWQQNVYLLGGEIVFGIGPGASPQTLAALEAPVIGELHNDYLAALLERGLVGSLGVVALCITTLWLSSRLKRQAQRCTRRWNVNALVGCTVTVWLSALSLEILHLRHVWLFFALVASLSFDTSMRLTHMARRGDLRRNNDA